MRRKQKVPEGDWVFLGRRYRDEAEYEAAVAKWQERRRRLLERLDREKP